WAAVRCVPNRTNLLYFLPTVVQRLDRIINENLGVPSKRASSRDTATKPHDSRAEAIPLSPTGCRNCRNFQTKDTSVGNIKERSPQKKSPSHSIYYRYFLNRG